MAHWICNQQRANGSADGCSEPEARISVVSCKSATIMAADGQNTRVSPCAQTHLGVRLEARGPRRRCAGVKDFQEDSILSSKPRSCAP
eukprot:6202377-Pleurochrysis_carterae.AAC.3